MGAQRKKGADVYRKIKYTFSAYGENKVYGGGASIHLHFGDASEVVVLEINVNFDTLDDAEAAIIGSVKHWIDIKLGS